LDKADCPWEPYSPLPFGGRRSLVVTTTRANFSFEIYEGEVPVLNVVGPPGDGHGCNVMHRQNA
jgi:hypothetical protein